MEFLLFIIPFITSIILFFFFNKKIVWWEYIVLIVPPILFALLVKVLMVTINVHDTEYLGGYVLKATHYEDWDETVLVTRVVTTGKTTRTYVVPERRYHPDEYTYTSSIDSSERSISKNVYMAMKKQMNSPEQFRDMNRDYRSKDGDAYDIYWNGKIEDMYDITKSHSYENKVAATQSHNIYKGQRITRKKALELGLYDYPPIDRYEIQNPILGPISDTSAIKAIRMLNACFGKEYQFRMYICIFPNKAMEISELQKQYWEVGNKNEFVVCLGMQNDTTVSWVNSFSWCDEPILEVLTRTWFAEHPTLDIPMYAQFLAEKIPSNWNRKNFEDFNYLNVNLAMWQYVVIIVLMLIVEGILSGFVIYNEYTNDKKEKTNYGY